MAATITPTSDARRGRVLIGRFKNAVATFAGGEQVEGIFERLAESPMLGGLAINSRDISFECLTADLPADTDSGAVLDLAMGNALATSVGVYKVVRGGRVDDLEELTTRLALELA